jgi:hypothetical protein
VRRRRIGADSKEPALSPESSAPPSTRRPPHVPTCADLDGVAQTIAISWQPDMCHGRALLSPEGGHYSWACCLFRAHMDLAHIFGIARKPHLIAAERSEAAQPARADLRDKVAGRHRPEAHIPDAHGPVS